jgi:hypothetical protein
MHCTSTLLSMSMCGTLNGSKSIQTPQTHVKLRDYTVGTIIGGGIVFFEQWVLFIDGETHPGAGSDNYRVRL